MNLKEELLKTLIREEVRRAILNESMPGWKAAGIPEKLSQYMVKFTKISPNIQFREITTVPNEDQLENGHIIVNIIDPKNAVAILKMRSSFNERWVYKIFPLRNGKIIHDKYEDTLKKAMAKYVKPEGTLLIGKNDIPLYGYFHSRRGLTAHWKKRGIKKGDPDWEKWGTDYDVRAFDDWPDKFKDDAIK